MAEPIKLQDGQETGWEEFQDNRPLNQFKKAELEGLQPYETQYITEDRRDLGSQTWEDTTK